LADVGAATTSMFIGGKDLGTMIQTMLAYTPTRLESNCMITAGEDENGRC
jgi:hypothetical protein